MHLWATIIGAGIILSILLDAFETIVLPRRVQRGFRLTAFFYRNTWRPWARAAQYIRKASRRTKQSAFSLTTRVTTAIGE